MTQLDELLNDLALAKDCTAAAVLDKLDRADDLVDVQRKLYESERRERLHCARGSGSQSRP